MKPTITQKQIDNMMDFIEKQEIKKGLGEVFCEDYEINDFDIAFQQDNQKAAKMIILRYGQIEIEKFDEGDPWDDAR